MRAKGASNHVRREPSFSGASGSVAPKPSGFVVAATRSHYGNAIFEHVGGVPPPELTDEKRTRSEVAANSVGAGLDTMHPA